MKPLPFLCGISLVSLVRGFVLSPLFVRGSPPRSIQAFMCSPTPRQRVTTISDADIRIQAARSRARALFQTDKRPVVLFDGVCVFCNNWVNVALDLDKTAKLRFSPLQSDSGRALLALSGRSMDDISSIVLVKQDGTSHVQSDAVIEIGSILGGGVGLLTMPGILVPKAVRDGLYNIVANNRYNIMGKREDCRCSDEGYAERFV
ncbi:unnamed protein product [Discosporangium mesarthrocarpum]